MDFSLTFLTYFWRGSFLLCHDGQTESLVFLAWVQLYNGVFIALLFWTDFIPSFGAVSIRGLHQTKEEFYFVCTSDFRNSLKERGKTCMMSTGLNSRMLYNRITKFGWYNCFWLFLKSSTEFNCRQFVQVKISFKDEVKTWYKSPFKVRQCLYH